MNRPTVILLSIFAAACLCAQEQIHQVKPDLIQAARYRLLQAVDLQKGGTAKSTSLKPPVVQGLPTIGSPKVLVLPIEFSDTPHKASLTMAKITEQFFSNDPAKISLRNFFWNSSFGQLNVTGEVMPWFQFNMTRAAFAQWLDVDPAPGTTAEPDPINNAVKFMIQYYVDMGGLDFEQYDNDGDGKIDLVFLIYAGAPTKRGELWWSFATGLDPDWVTTSNIPPSSSTGMNIGLGLDSVIFCTEDHTPPVWCHEFAHALGLPDLYDGDGDQPAATRKGPDGGVGTLDLLDLQDTLTDTNSFCKFLLGWIQPKIITATTKGIILERATDPSLPKDETAVVLWPAQNGTPDPMFGDFFVVEHRSRTDTYKENDYGIPGDGLLIWHVDSTLNSAKTWFVFNNTDTPHKLVRLMEADGLEKIEKGRSADTGDLYRQENLFGVDTFPSSCLYGHPSPSYTSIPNSQSADAKPSWLGLSNIIYPTGKSTDAIAFDVFFDESAPDGNPVAPTAVNNPKLAFCDFTFPSTKQGGGNLTDAESGISGYNYELSIIGPGKSIFRFGSTALSKLSFKVTKDDLPEAYRDIYVDQYPVFVRVAALNGAGIQSEWSNWSSAATVKWPYIASFSPAVATAGTTLSITGANLEQYTSIVFMGGGQGKLTATDSTGKNYSVVVPKTAATGRFKTYVNPNQTAETMPPTASSLTDLQIVTAESVANLTESAAWRVAAVNNGTAVLSGSSGAPTKLEFKGNTDWAQIISLPLSSWPRNPANQYTISIRPSANLGWGGINLHLNSKTSTPNLNNAFAGYTSIQGIKAGEWRDVTWTLTADQVQTLAKGFTDLTLSFSISAPAGTTIELRGKP